MEEQRIRQLKNILKDKNLDGLLVSNFYNIFYLTGFKTLTENEREAFVLVTRNKIYLITDGRYVKNPKFETLSSKSFDRLRIPSKVEGQILNFKLEIKIITPEKKLIQHIKEIIRYEDIGILGIESEDVKLFEYLNFKSELGVRLRPIDRLIVHLREIKDSQEIEYIKKACEIGDQCLSSIIRIIEPGQTEKEIAWKIERWIREKGHEIAFEPIVAVNKNSAIPHYLTKEGKSKAKKNSIILIDFGVKYKNYCSDMTRMIFVGQPKQEIVNVYNQLLTIQQSTINQLKKTKYLNEIDRGCRLLITDYKLLVYPHSTGHGIGLEVHEYPKISPNSKDLLKVGQVFTIEPGVYFQGKWGMRIEDTVLIDESLQPNVLTKFPRQLLIL